MWALKTADQLTFTCLASTAPLLRLIWPLRPHSGRMLWRRAQRPLWQLLLPTMQLQRQLTWILPNFATRVNFVPLVPESTGAWDRVAGQLLLQIACSAATRTGDDSAALHSDLLQEVSVLIRSHRARAVLNLPPCWASGVNTLLLGSWYAVGAGPLLRWFQRAYSRWHCWSAGCYGSFVWGLSPCFPQWAVCSSLSQGNSMQFLLFAPLTSPADSATLGLSKTPEHLFFFWLLHRSMTLGSVWHLTALFTFSRLIPVSKLLRVTPGELLTNVSDQISVTWDVQIDPDELDLRWHDSSGDTFILRNINLCQLLHTHRPQWCRQQDTGNVSSQNFYWFYSAVHPAPILP